MRLPKPAWFIVLSLPGLACGPGSLGPSETDVADGTETGGESCVAGGATIEATISGTENLTSECVVTLVDRDQADSRRWTFGLDCHESNITIELLAEPTFAQAPIDPGQSVAVAAWTQPGFQWLEVLSADGLRLAILDWRASPMDVIDEPLFGHSIEFEWTAVPSCGATDPECGAVEPLQLDAHLDTAGDPEIVSLGVGPSYAELTNGDAHYGVWTGDNWLSECDGQPTHRLTYAVVALP